MFCVNEMLNQKSIKWIKLEKEGEQFFVFAMFYYLNEAKRIRFAIDKKSADGMRIVLNERPFKEKYGTDYSFWYSGYSTDNDNKNYEHYVEIRLGSMRHKKKVHCSKSFCQNLRWLTEIKSISDLDNLSINESENTEQGH
jgi:hypothetical protein